MKSVQWTWELGRWQRMWNISKLRQSAVKWVQVSQPYSRSAEGYMLRIHGSTWASDWDHSGSRASDDSWLRQQDRYVSLLRDVYSHESIRWNQDSTSRLHDRFLDSEVQLGCRGNRYKLTQKHVHYNLTKYSFSNKVVSIWNSLPDYVVSACSVKVLKAVWIIFGKTTSVFVNGRPVCPVSEAEVLFNVIWVLKYNY